MHRKVYNDLPTQSNISSELKLNMKYYSKHKFNVRGPIGLWVPQDYQLIFLQEVSRYSEDDINLNIFLLCTYPFGTFNFLCPSFAALATVPNFLYSTDFLLRT